MSEVYNSDPSLFGKTKRALAVAIAPLAIAAACANGPQSEAEPTSTTSVPVIELSTEDESSPEQLAQSITDGLNDEAVVEGVMVAYDHVLAYPDRKIEERPDGVCNPFVLGEGVYGYSMYDDETGKVEVLIAPAGATLTQVSPDQERIPEPDRPINPRIEEATISSVYYESSSYEHGRYYVTAIDQQPGFVEQGAEIEWAGCPMQIGK